MLTTSILESDTEKVISTGIEENGFITRIAKSSSFDYLKKTELGSRQDTQILMLCIGSCIATQSIFIINNYNLL